MKNNIRQKVKYLMLNLMAPGFGHISMGKWFRGILFFTIAVGSLIWLVIAFGHNMTNSWYSAMDGRPIKYNILEMVLPIILFIIDQIYSLLDILFFCKIPDKKETEDNNNSPDPAPLKDKTAND